MLCCCSWSSRAAVRSNRMQAAATLFSTRLRQTLRPSAGKTPLSSSTDNRCGRSSNGKYEHASVAEQKMVVEQRGILGDV